MKRARSLRSGQSAADEPAPRPSSTAAVQRLAVVATPRAAKLPPLATALIVSLNDDGIVARVGGSEVPASLDPSVHRAVITGAHARGERVLVELADDGSAVIMGALRTQPTPGIDASDEYVIEAKRIALKASSEISMTSLAAGVVVRALGEVETYADRILSRAEGVHKIVGRMLRLN